ncbi:hypothetical protein AQF52_7247 [Streptomyces venezuelae]|uniref:hypothetical protein n=1 Tax=Streptomyces gardneri TaxID=66892 RepID=UPI0006BD5D1A|nr:hypothetical protein [Streptomyces gardneri]ALO12833.1 hypothetical protein AQF52_7247 [Streptomyces venezuelae]QPK49543.1 hypothetical protein H4W23_36370 [Streptomyces gardneri]WRK41085.1 hypothetical protein U0M97_36590 [Streptomyces venezuelae]CUM36511.1 hypothetical protein BN2537_1987 [Streptomyces venezuelae]
MSGGDRPERAEGESSEESDERGEHGEHREGDESDEGDELLLSSAGCVLALAGVLAAAAYAVPRAEYSYDGGFEGQDTDWTVILVELPLILLGGFALPPLTWAAATRYLRPWAAALVCVAVVALGLWGLDAVWHPQQGPGPGYERGI